MNKSHGSPYDRGSADRYYGRQFAPQYYRDGGHVRVEIDLMTAEEIFDYKVGWNGCLCRKDWGGGIYAPEQSDVPLMDIRDFRDKGGADT